tara:strand:+ start:378 stop:602 length:225 start_codon:yes stop_codon:yes gene_type:complete
VAETQLYIFVGEEDLKPRLDNWVMFLIVGSAVLVVRENWRYWFGTSCALDEIHHMTHANFSIFFFDTSRDIIRK